MLKQCRFAAQALPKHFFASRTVSKRFMAAPAPNGEAPGPSKSELKKQAKEAEKAKRQAEVAAKQAAERAAREAAEPDDAVQNYGQFPIHQSADYERERTYTDLRKLSREHLDQHVGFMARIGNSRTPNAKMAFFELRQDGWPPASVQALLLKAQAVVSKQMIKFALALSRETLVYVEGTVQEPAPDAETGKKEVRSTTVQDVEIKITKLHVTAPVTASRLPFGLTDLFESQEQPNAAKPLPVVKLATRLSNRVFDLRVPVNQAIFRISASVERFFRTYLESQGFVSIHSPKLQGAATESGASVFAVQYFNRKAFLAQSPQFAKQQCIAAGMGRVYEIGPVFRAENSFTPRHMTEFTGLDLEMELTAHYDEAVDVLDQMLLSIFRGLQKEHGREIELVRTAFPSEDFVFLDKTLRLPFAEGVKMLEEDGWKDEEGKPQDPYEDLSTPAEKRLGALVKAKYNTDYYILDKFPLAVRPFYTMPDPRDPRLSNSYDFMMRGQEILSGAQRVHDAKLLEDNLRRVGIDPKEVQEYVDAFTLGCPPHAGGGIGLERVVMLFLGLTNIRYSSLFPRDPMSFSDQQVKETAAGIAEDQATAQPPS